MKKKWFFGWDNIKWFITEIGNIYSNKDSFFSKKRIESSIAFIVGQWGMIYWLSENHAKLTASDVVLWSGVEFAMAGFIISQIQKEKSKNETPEKSGE